MNGRLPEKLGAASLTLAYGKLSPWLAQHQVYRDRQCPMPSSHYASTWKTGGAAVKPLEEVNAIGRRYAELPEEIPAAGDRMVSNPEKENLLLELCQCFHPYLMKYLVMICR